MDNLSGSAVTALHISERTYMQSRPTLWRRTKWFFSLSSWLAAPSPSLAKTYLGRRKCLPSHLQGQAISGCLSHHTLMKTSTLFCHIHSTYLVIPLHSYDLTFEPTDRCTRGPTPGDACSVSPGDPSRWRRSGCPAPPPGSGRLTSAPWTCSSTDLRPVAGR